MQDFRELRVWGKGHELALAVYQTTAQFPREERYGLTSQMRRCAVSIPANVAEGCCRTGDPEFARFAQIAMGSASELRYYCILAHDLELFGQGDYKRLEEMVNEVQKMLASLIKTLRSNRQPERANS
jgi:four helix bundle protein